MFLKLTNTKKTAVKLSAILFYYMSPVSPVYHTVVNVKFDPLSLQQQQQQQQLGKVRAGYQTKIKRVKI